LTSGNPNPQEIPLVRIHAPAGCLVFKQGDSATKMVYVEDGELNAFDKGKLLYKMPKGSLVGVSAVMDHSKFKHDISASINSTLAIIDESALAAIFKKAPNWLLAIINSISKRTRSLKQSLEEPIFADPLQSLSKFLMLHYEGEPLEAEKVLKEFLWQTRASKDSVQNAVRELVRRNILKLFPDQSGKQNALISIEKPQILEILVDYLRCQHQNKIYPPLELSQRERACLEFLALEDSILIHNSGEWIKYLQIATPEASIVEIIKFQELGIFKHLQETNKLHLEKKILENFLLAIHNERSLTGSAL